MRFPPSKQKRMFCVRALLTEIVIDRSVSEFELLNTGASSGKLEVTVNVVESGLEEEKVA